MSVEPVWRKDQDPDNDRPAGYRVRWREAGKNRSRVIGRKRDAEAFDAEVRRKRRLGELGMLEASGQTLSEFASTWWDVHAAPNLAPSTLALYQRIFDGYIEPRLGTVRLRELTPELIQRFSSDLDKAGVGREWNRKSLTLLNGILERAVEWGKLAHNPGRSVRKPQAPRRRRIRPLAPETVERLRLASWTEQRAKGEVTVTLSPRDATLVSVLAYAGLRPQEALALEWRDVGEKALMVERAVSLGEVEDTKTRRGRSVRLVSPLARDLAEYQLAMGRPIGRALVFPARGGGPWTPSIYANWRRRVYHKAAEALELESKRPYDLRHSFASLLIQEGRLSIAEIAEQMGHSTEMLLGTYTHVIRELSGEQLPAEEQIRVAREQATEGSSAWRVM